MVQSDGDEAAFLVEVPAEAVAALGARKRPPVLATLNGYQYRTTISTYGGRFYLPMRREIRQAAGLRPGDAVSVNIVLDELPRLVELLDDFRLALDAEPTTRAAFERLSYTHRREYVDWILETKRDETRRRRIERAVAMIGEGKKKP
ncbi:MAG: DUF1905 domain-containing protein [Chloroflexi bacterium]|nr:DUF1905 domain-containing protein [Chloroflexota bacterium]